MSPVKLIDALMILECKARRPQLDACFGPARSDQDCEAPAASRLSCRETATRPELKVEADIASIS